MRIVITMVFGWGKKKEKQEPAEIQSRIITLSEIPKILSDLESLRSKTVVAETKSFQSKILPKLRELNDIAAKLEKDDLNIEDVDKNLKTLVLRGKKQVISVIKNESGKNSTTIKSVSDALNFSNEVGQRLKKIGDVLGRQTRVIHIFAKKYAQKLKDILSDVNSDKDALYSVIQNYEKSQSALSEIRSLLEKIETTQREASQKKLRVNELKQLAEQTANTIEKIKDKIEKIKQTSEYTEFLRVRKILESQEQEKNQIKHSIDDQFTKISRPLSKYVYVSSLDKDKKQILETLTRDPFLALISNAKNDILSILQSVKKAVLTGSVSVKDQDKIVSYIDETCVMLDTFLQKIKQLENRQNELQNKLNVFNIDNLQTEQAEMDKNEKNLSDYKSKIKMLESEIAELENSIPVLSSKIESLLKMTSSIKYVLKL